MAVKRFANAVLVLGDFYILQLRDEHARACPGQWGLFGGGIEDGETPRAALIRELREELEIEAYGAAHLLDIGQWSVFAVEVTLEQWERRALHEGVGVGMFSAEAVLGMGLNGIATGAVMVHRCLREMSKYQHIHLPPAE